MSTKKPEALTVITPTEEALAALQAAGIDLGDQTGKDQIDDKNLLRPVLAICQKTSPQLEPDNPKYVEGLKFLDLFNSLTGEIYGTGPLQFIPLALKEHGMEFNPFDQGGGIKDRNVPLDDERLQWHGDEKPVATLFMDYAVLLIPSMDVIVLSFKSTGLVQGRLLKTLTKNPRLPLFAQVYQVSTTSAKNNYGTFGVYAIKGVGIASPDRALYAKAIIETLGDFRVDHEAETDVPQGQSTATEEKVPF